MGGRSHGRSYSWEVVLVGGRICHPWVEIYIMFNGDAAWCVEKKTPRLTRFYKSLALRMQKRLKEARHS